MTKFKPDTHLNMNMENIEDEDQITTQMVPKYGITTRSKNKRDEDDK